MISLLQSIRIHPRPVAGRSRVPRTRRQRGAIIVLFALMMVLTLAFLAMSLDLGYLCSVRTDLQAAVDSGALAGAGVILDGQSKSLDTGRKFTQLNLNNQGVRTTGKEADVNVQLGHWNKRSRSFQPGGRPRDAVKVTATINKVSLFYANSVGPERFAATASAVATYKPRDIMLVLDVSASMNEARGGIRKIDELREAVRTFMGYLRQAKGKDRVGFAYYSTEAHFGHSLSYGLNGVENDIIRSLEPDGWTNIADGMQLAREELNNNRREIAEPLMILLTDGAANMNQPGDVVDRPEAIRRVIEQAELAKNDEIPIFTMALDSFTTEVDVQLMQRVAEITGSESVHVIAGERDWTGDTQLRDVFRRVANDRPLRLVD